MTRDAAQSAFPLRSFRSTVRVVVGHRTATRSSVIVCHYVLIAALYSCGGHSNDPRSAQAGATTSGNGGSGGSGASDDGGTATSGDAGKSGHGGTSPAGGAGTTSTGGGGSDGGTSAIGGSGGETPSAGDAGESAGGADSTDEILAALDTDDATIDAASGAALLELARDIGFARGYAVCTCLLPDGAPPIEGDSLRTCAIVESGFAENLFDEAKARCVADRSQAIAEFDAYLRCNLKNLRDVARVQAQCFLDTPPVTFMYMCEYSAEADDLLRSGSCDNAFFCDDGRFTETGRCDKRVDCTDWEDERNCADLFGVDLLLWDNEILYPAYACGTESRCGLVADPPFCSPDTKELFLCGDGTDIPTQLVCDRTADCANGRDEELCLR